MEKTVTISHLEIYNDELGDLQRPKGLATPRTVAVRRDRRTTSSLALVAAAKKRGVAMRYVPAAQLADPIDYGSGDRGETALWRQRVAAAVAAHQRRLKICYDPERGVVVQGLSEVRPSVLCICASYPPPCLFVCHRISLSLPDID